MSSGTTYGDGFKNGARSMYISKSSEVKCISSMHNPFDETGLANSLKLCLESAELIYLSDKIRLLQKRVKRVWNINLPYMSGTWITRQRTMLEINFRLKENKQVTAKWTQFRMIYFFYNNSFCNVQSRTSEELTRWQVFHHFSCGRLPSRMSKCKKKLAQRTK